MYGCMDVWTYTCVVCRKKLYTNYIKINANSDKSIRKELKSDGEKIINLPSMKTFKDRNLS